MKPIMLVVIGLFCSCAFADNNTDAARDAALAWLAEVDNGQYGASWKDASPMFKANVREQRWVRIISGARRQLGSVVSRELKSATYTEHVPKAPEGHYVILEFSTYFANNPSVIETVTPMLSHGKWKVSGYYIR